MRRLAEVGADGVHLDKLVPAGLDFNWDLPTSPDRASWEGTLEGLREILEACREVNPEFCLSVESAWDRLLQYTDIAWIWHSHLGVDHVPALKYAFPQWLPMTAVCQPYDYSDVNNAVRHGYQILVGPARYTASMEDEPMRPLSAYIAEVTRIREELKDTVFQGEFLDSRGSHVEGPLELRYNTHRNPRTGKRACIVVNFGEVTSEARVYFEGHGGDRARVYQPFAETRTDALPATVEIPAEQVAVVVEE
jgi:hypothetical protein